MIRGKFLLSGQPETEIVYALRRRVFVEEQGFSAENEVDAHDSMSVYALVLDEDGTPGATGRLYIDDDSFHIGRVCVLKEMRGRGLGDLVMRMLLYRALELQCTSVTLSSQLPIIPFYTRYGFKPVGDVYLDEGVQHRTLAAAREEIDIEGSCHKGGACGDCDGHCDTCEKRP